MAEDFKKNFVLLSRVAKENKYAQEYLGLLARRGDIGSIRIGKRWYTKAEWFSEFLVDAEARKAETKNFDFSVMPVTEKIEQKKEIVVKETAPIKKITEHQIQIAKSLEAPQEKYSSAVRVETSQVAVPARKEPIQKESEIVSLKREEVKIILPRIVSPKPVFQNSFVVNRKLETINLKTNRDAKSVFQRAALNAPKIKKPVPEKKIQPLLAENSPIIDNWLNIAGDPSPNFVPVGSRMGFFPKFAFSMSVVLLLVLLIQFGWVYKNELKGIIGIGSGIVAGAQDRKDNLDVVRNSSASYLGNQGEKVRENISLSRVLIRAVMERER